MTAVLGALAPASPGRLRSVREVAPEVADALEAAWTAAVRLLRERVTQLQAHVAAGLGTGPPAPDAGSDPVEVALARVAQAFVHHVPDVPADAVAVLHDRLGRAGTREVVEALWVFDQAARLAVVHGALLGAHDGGVGMAYPGVGSVVAETVGAANAEVHHAVMRLLSTPVAPDLRTVELVRLRAGFHHNCRNCRSLRLVVDGVPVADEVDVARLSVPGPITGVPDRTLAALAYADAYMSEPRRVGDGLRAWLGVHFTRAEIVVLTLALSAWNWQKVLVALDLDRAADPNRLTGVVIDGDGTMSRTGPLPA